jgi:UDPglucose 6-dehydrogenase
MLDAIGSDSRIGKKYLRAGLSYGGPCFPRDNRLLAYTARQMGLEAPLAEASDRVNQRTNEDLFEKVRGMIKKDDVVAVLGVTYKPDTYITEEAAGLFLAQQLKRHGYRVLVHDFAANPANAPALHEFECLASLAELKKRSEVTLAVICWPWDRIQKFSRRGSFNQSGGGTSIFSPVHTMTRFFPSFPRGSPFTTAVPANGGDDSP